MEASIGRVNFCWSSPALSSLVPAPAGLMAKFCCLHDSGNLIEVIDPSDSFSWPQHKAVENRSEIRFCNTPVDVT
jgi:hypothetical protein